MGILRARMKRDRERNVWKMGHSLPYSNRANSGGVGNSGQFTLTANYHEVLCEVVETRGQMLSNCCSQRTQPREGDKDANG